MTLADEFLAMETEIAGLFGQAATLVVPTATIAPSGEVTETTTSASVTLAGPIAETRRYVAEGSDSRVSATFYLPGSAVTGAPKPSDRVVIGSRKWQVVAVATDSISGVATSYRLDCGEVAGD